MSTHETLVRARNLLDRDGWCQYTPHDEFGRHCILGAVGLAKGLGGTLPVNHPALEVLREAALGEGYPFVYSLSLWNDWPDRTKDEVLAAFDRAIAATAPDPLAGLDLTTQSETVTA